MPTLISLDTETTGLDLQHGAQPFFVTICDESGHNAYWQWRVDPLLRKPIVPVEDLEEIQEAIDNADKIVLQNPKFDVAALNTVFCGRLRWDWTKVYDTLLAGHLLASNQPHDLTTMALVYCGINIQPLEDALEKACHEARRIAKSKFPKWRIAEKGLPEMPSAKEKVWKFDMWLPKAIATATRLPARHPWRTVLADYSNGDSAVTMILWKTMRKLLRERGLWEIYLERLKVLPVVYQMERRGVTVNSQRLDELTKAYKEQSQSCAKVCLDIAERRGCELELPKSGVNNSLKNFLFNDPKGLKIVSPSKTPSGNPALNKNAVGALLDTLEAAGDAAKFLTSLRDKRSRDTAVAYMDGYKRFWIPIKKQRGWFRLHPSLNPTGTDTLRWSSSNPNEQNISKKEGFNLRYCFGPAPGREWWSLDAKNIELRLPAYEAGETEMLELFERPDDPPYFGSNHLLVFSILWPKEWKKYGADVKKQFASTLYQWVKNGNFAVQYGAMEESGTADRAYHQVGAQARIEARFGKIKLLNQKMIDMAVQCGYIETIPDRTVNPEHGYPLLCTRNKWGAIKPTVPLNYHIQGTAMWWMMMAMIRCQAYLDQLNAELPEPQYFMIMQVHDELVFDFPFRKNHGNLPKVRKIKRLMEQGGRDLVVPGRDGIPTPVSCEYHAESWSEGVSL